MKHDQKSSIVQKLGTNWVGKGEGATLAALCRAAGLPVKAGDEAIVTDLALTGQPFQEYDHVRMKFMQNERIA